MTLAGTMPKSVVSPLAVKAPGTCSFCAGYLWGPDPTCLITEGEHKGEPDPDAPFTKCPDCWPRNLKPNVERSNPSLKELRWADARKQWAADMPLLNVGEKILNVVAPNIEGRSKRHRLNSTPIFYGESQRTMRFVTCLLNEISVRTEEACAFTTLSSALDACLDYKDKSLWRHLCSSDVLVLVVDIPGFSSNPMINSGVPELLTCRNHVGAYTFFSMFKNPQDFIDKKKDSTPLDEFIRTLQFTGVPVSQYDMGAV